MVEAADNEETKNHGNDSTLNIQTTQPDQPQPAAPQQPAQISRLAIESGAAEHLMPAMQEPV